MLWVRLIISTGLASLLWYKISTFDEMALHNASSAIAGVSATMLGFMIAALSILTAISSQRLIKNMQRTGHYKKLLKELYHTSGAYAAGMVVSLMAIFTSPPYLQCVMPIVIFVLSYATLMMISVGRKFWVVLNNIHPD